MIYIIRKKTTQKQTSQMLETLETYIKVAVDIQRKILTGGGILHADCVATLLEDGSKQEDIWGADWIPESEEIRFEALINIRPKQNNPSMTILDAEIRKKVESIVKEKLK